MKHGKSNTKLHNVWKGMRKRCLYPTTHNYGRYGARGIKICDEWGYFSVFYDWAIKNGYNEGLILDREDNDGNYEPSNCRWTTPKISANNRGDHHYLMFDGIKHNVTQWAEILGVTDAALFRRIKIGWTDEKVITHPFLEPIRKRKIII